MMDGGCLCGRVRYRVAGPVHETAHCHCTMCRRGSGAPVVTWAVTSPDHFAWTAGTPATYASSPGCKRTFCAACGTKLTFTDAKRPGDVDIATGSLDDPGGVTVGIQIYGRSKVAWVRIDPHVPFRAGEEPTDSPAAPLEAAETLEGGCLCGTVRFCVTGAPREAVVCHCTACRRSTGGPFAAWGRWPRDRFRAISGTTTAYAATSEGARRFCQVCGATVSYETKGDETVADILLAGLDAPGRVPPEAHECVADAVPGLVIDDPLPRWPGAVGAP